MKRLAVVAALITSAAACAAPPSGRTCRDAVDTWWPASSRAWMHSIIQRESRGIATAQNPSSSAAGCTQLLKMHAYRIPGGWGQRYNPDANILGALDLYREAGTSPWSL